MTRIKGYVEKRKGKMKKKMRKRIERNGGTGWEENLMSEGVGLKAT